MKNFGRMAGRGGLAVGCCAVALLTTVAGTAYAVDNLPPERPLVKDLTSGGKACGSGDNTAYVAERPRLSAVLYDSEEIGRAHV